MKTKLISFLGILLPACLVFATERPAADNDPFAKKSPLVVHEWGTFTSMQGSNGSALEGLQHEEESLPDFVYSRTKIRECPLRAHGYKGLEVPASKVTQKMETPVIYFHTQSSQKIRVRVDFMGGLITQWYPVSNLLGPAENKIKDGPLDISKVESSFLEWDAELIPWTGQAPGGIHQVEDTNPWKYAREVHAASVRTLPHTGPLTVSALVAGKTGTAAASNRMGPFPETERYLFYRGLGTFSMPVKIESSEDGRSLVRNTGQHAMPQVFALEMTPKGGRFQSLGKLGGGQTAELSLVKSPLRNKDVVVQEIKTQIQSSLVQQGLFDDEAAAMVKTWSRQWFTTEGSRLIYIVARECTDKVLPLQITPTPDATVRVLVGRLEYLTPKVEAEITDALRNRLSKNDALRDAATARLMNLGRFLEPCVRCALAKNTDQSVQKSGLEILESLQKLNSEASTLASAGKG